MYSLVFYALYVESVVCVAFDVGVSPVVCVVSVVSVVCVLYVFSLLFL